jgi:hypothetical protein
MSLLRRLLAGGVCRAKVQRKLEVSYCPGSSSARSGVDSLHRAHVVQDLIPYSCIVDNCGPPDEMYLTAEKLLAHMLEKHSVERWTCDYCAYPAGVKTETSTSTPRQFFQTAEDWTKHIAAMHGDLIAPQERSILVDMNKRRLIGPLSCPLCGFVSDSLTAVIDDHILSHLHEFALRALPDAVDDSLDEIESRITQVHSVLSHTQSADNATDELQYPAISFEDLSQAMHDLKLLRPHQTDWVIAAPPDSDKAAIEVWQARAGRLHAMIMIRNDIDPERWLNAFNEEIDGLNSTLRYIAPPYCPGNGSWGKLLRYSVSTLVTGLTSLRALYRPQTRPYSSHDCEFQ